MRNARRRRGCIAIDKGGHWLVAMDRDRPREESIPNLFDPHVGELNQNACHILRYIVLQQRHSQRLCSIVTEVVKTHVLKNP